MSSVAYQQYGDPAKNFERSSDRRFDSWFFTEQSIGSAAMRGCRVAVFCNPRNLCLQQCDPFVQFMPRIGREILVREEACGITFRAGLIGFLHQNTASQVWVLAVNGAGG